MRSPSLLSVSYHLKKSQAVPGGNFSFYYDMSVTGGSEGVFHDGNNTYCISLGDSGYMTSPSFIPVFSHATAFISYDPAVSAGNDSGSGNNGPEAGNDTDSSSDDTVSSAEPVPTQRITKEGGESQLVIVDPITGKTEIAETAVPEGTNAGGNGGGRTPASTTFDPVIIAGAAAAIGAAGIVISEKRK